MRLPQTFIECAGTERPAAQTVPVARLGLLGTPGLVLFPASFWFSVVSTEFSKVSDIDHGDSGFARMVPQWPLYPGLKIQSVADAARPTKPRCQRSVLSITGLISFRLASKSTLGRTAATSTVEAAISP